MIRFEHVSKTFKNQSGSLIAVNDVSLQIEKGEVFGIIGYSGAGKSTMLRMINQLEKQDGGKIYIDNTDITSLPKKELLQLRMKIGMIFQHFNLLWSRTVFENIALPLEIAGLPKEEIKPKVNDLIELVELQGKENSYPSTLSGGQKQRVAIARALANNPNILLCDEATSALDPKTTNSIIELLKKINRKLGITIVMITHQMEVAEKICHRIAVMVDGKIVECNKTIDIFENPIHDATKNFVQARPQMIEELQLHKSLKEVYPLGKLLRLTFSDNTAKQPILSKIMKKAKLNLSIVHANISNTITSSFGTMIIHISKEDESDLDEFIQLLNDDKIKVEVI